eukprot:TRINITY_DN70128_c0_g1_i1.p1 TRINITY_DN70128_c0_g1~~TRINITY_DN70128_c0_g1_i1.p1  ORF type:complete len:160 (+),score=10.20 TRINITY_DN70128_c0_g1_i1:229-708(+)
MPSKASRARLAAFGPVVAPVSFLLLVEFLLTWRSRRCSPPLETETAPGLTCCACGSGLPRVFKKCWAQTLAIRQGRFSNMDPAKMTPIATSPLVGALIFLNILWLKADLILPKVLLPFACGFTAGFGAGPLGAKHVPVEAALPLGFGGRLSLLFLHLPA